jgi:hypothetical protein
MTNLQWITSILKLNEYAKYIEDIGLVSTNGHMLFIDKSHQYIQGENYYNPKIGWLDKIIETDAIPAEQIRRILKSKKYYSNFEPTPSNFIINNKKIKTLMFNDIKIDANYYKKAIKGLETFELFINLNSKFSPIFIQDKTKIAVIMPIQ